VGFALGPNFLWRLSWRYFLMSSRTDDFVLVVSLKFKLALSAGEVRDLSVRSIEYCGTRGRSLDSSVLDGIGCNS
jgi:hypothetical protein